MQYWYVSSRLLVVRIRLCSCLLTSGYCFVLRCTENCVLTTTSTPYIHGHLCMLFFIQDNWDITFTLFLQAADVVCSACEAKIDRTIQRLANRWFGVKKEVGWGVRWVHGCQDLVSRFEASVGIFRPRNGRNTGDWLDKKHQFCCCATIWFQMFFSFWMNCVGSSSTLHCVLFINSWNPSSWQLSQGMTEQQNYLLTSINTKWKANLLPSLKLTVRPWKWMVGRWSFPFEMAQFQGLLLLVSGSVAVFGYHLHATFLSTEAAGETQRPWCLRFVVDAYQGEVGFLKVLMFGLPGLKVKLWKMTDSVY